MSHILIIDDDPQLGRSLERVLERDGLSCRRASDPVEALEAAVLFRPDAVLIELQSDYAQTLARLRGALGAIPFLVMAGHQAELAELGELLGPLDDWLAKPAAPRELIVRLRTALRRAHAN